MSNAAIASNRYLQQEIFDFLEPMCVLLRDQQKPPVRLSKDRESEIGGEKKRAADDSKIEMLC